MIDVVAIGTQGIFVLVFVLALIGWLRYRDATRFDIALMFGSLGIPIAIGLVTKAFGGTPAWLALISVLGILAQPYLTLRLVDRFRPVRRPVRLAALGGFLVSCALFIIFQPTLPVPVTLLIVAYFGGANAYAGWVFLRGARRVRGVTRRRIQFAAAALGLLAFVIVLAGVSSEFPSFAPYLRPSTTFLSPAAAIAFYFAFATPRALRRQWQIMEFHQFLRDISGLGSDVRLQVTIDRLLQVSIAAVDGEAARIIVQEPKVLRVYGGSSEDPPIPSSTGHGLMMSAISEGQPLITTDPKDLSPFERGLARAHASRTVLAVPIMTTDRKWGALVVTTRSRPLFPEDDLDLLLLMSAQVAYALRSAEAENELVRQAAELARSNADLQQFAYVASHDLKEPLRMVASFVTLLQKKYDGQLDEKAQTYIRFAVEGATRMQGLIDGLLEYARVGASRQVETVPLDEVMEITRRSLGATIAETKGTLEASALPVVRGDKRQLTQVFQNLVSNALKFHKPGATPRVSVSASEDEDRWVIHVKDNGIGIDPQYRDQLFVLFRRLNSREDFAGNGIGLAVSQRIVRQAGGDLWVDSMPGEGATFSFSILKPEP